MCLAVRTTGNPTGIASRVRQELRALDASLPVLRIDTVEDQLDSVLRQERLVATTSSMFGVVSVLLACLGLYGVMSYTTARRTNEIGVRLALGATRIDVLGMVLRESAMLVAIGIAVGIPITLAATRLIASRLFGVAAGDPVTFVIAVALLIGVAAMAGFIPARRASKVDPMVALRYE
jgi:ABC-type antimicrobial peptide transport system permease subunit